MTTDQTRKQRLSLLAKSPAVRLNVYWKRFGLSPKFEWLRVPEIGGVMVRGRAGGSGAPFNLGEMTVTRCAVKIATGEVGHAYVQGRDAQKAQQVALIDALMQTDHANDLQREIIDPLSDLAAATRQRRAAKAAATKVDFFTLVRGED